MTALLNLDAIAQMGAERIVYCLVEGIFVAAFAFLLLRVVRRQNSGTRFAVWFTALVAIAALPLLSGGWSTDGLSSGTEPPAAALLNRTLSNHVMSNRAVVTLPGSWALYLFGAWAAIAGLGLTRVGLGVWQLRQLRKSCVPIDLQGVDPVIRETLSRCQSGRVVELCVSDQVHTPTAIGLAKPAVVIPSWLLQELTVTELQQVLLHEVAHVRRWDDWTNLAQKVLKALLFFHPAVWWIERKVSLEREMACDDAVLAETSSPRVYAECLVHLAEKSFLRRSVALAQAAVSRLGQTSLRVAQILDASRSRTTTQVWKPAVSLVATFAIACLVSPWSAPKLVAFEDSQPERLANSAASLPPLGVADQAIPPAIFQSTRTRPQTGGRKPLATRPRATEAKSPPLTIESRLKGIDPAFLAGDDPGIEPPRGFVAAKYSGASQFAVSETVLVFVVGRQRGEPESVTYQMNVWRITVLPPATNPVEKAVPPRIT